MLLQRNHPIWETFGVSEAMFGPQLINMFPRNDGDPPSFIVTGYFFNDSIRKFVDIGLGNLCQ